MLPGNCSIQMHAERHSKVGQMRPEICSKKLHAEMHNTQASCCLKCATPSRAQASLRQASGCLISAAQSWSLWGLVVAAQSLAPRIRLCSQRYTPCRCTLSLPTIFTALLSIQLTFCRSTPSPRTLSLHRPGTPGGQNFSQHSGLLGQLQERSGLRGTGPDCGCLCLQGAQCASAGCLPVGCGLYLQQGSTALSLELQQAHVRLSAVQHEQVQAQPHECLSTLPHTLSAHQPDFCTLAVSTVSSIALDHRQQHLALQSIKAQCPAALSPVSLSKPALRYSVT